MKKKKFVIVALIAVGSLLFAVPSASSHGKCDSIAEKPSAFNNVVSARGGQTCYGTTHAQNTAELSLQKRSGGRWVTVDFLIIGSAGDDEVFGTADAAYDCSTKWRLKVFSYATGNAEGDHNFDTFIGKTLTASGGDEARTLGDSHTASGGGAF